MAGAGGDLIERAVRLSPRDGVARAMRAEAAIMLSGAEYRDLEPQMREQLARDLDIAVEQASRGDYVFWARGLFRLAAERDAPGARADLRRNRDLNPAYQEAYDLEGQILTFEGAFDAAAEVFAHLVRRGTGNPMLPYRQYLRAVARLCGGRVDEAAEEAADAADTLPTERGLRLLHALCLERAGNPGRATEVRHAAATLAGGPSAVTRRLLLPYGFDWITRSLAP